MFTKIAGALGQAASQVAEAGGTIVGIRTGTKEPPFTVQRRVGAVEIRRYGARIAAETSVEADEEPARNEGFRRLARYIFGGNTAKATIAMTAPVAQQQGQKIAMTAPVATQRGESGDWVIRFFMPSEHTMDTLPIPNDDRVRLVEVPAESVAVLRFSGVASPEGGLTTHGHGNTSMAPRNPPAPHLPAAPGSYSPAMDHRPHRQAPAIAQRPPLGAEAAPRCPYAPR